MNDPIDHLIMKMGESLLRYQKLLGLNAPKSIVAREIEMIATRWSQLHERTKEACAWIRDNVKGYGISDRQAAMVLPVLCMDIADRKNRRERARRLEEELDDNPNPRERSNTQVLVEWEDIGEGMSGDYNPDDPHDVRLLRFTISTRPYDQQEWVQVQDGSFCTQMPVDTPPYLLEYGLHCIWNEVKDALNKGEFIKRICEEMSWCEPSWFAKGGRWEYRR